MQLELFATDEIETDKGPDLTGKNCPFCSGSLKTWGEGSWICDLKNRHVVWEKSGLYFQSDRGFFGGGGFYEVSG